MSNVPSVQQTEAGLRVRRACFPPEMRKTKHKAVHGLLETRYLHGVDPNERRETPSTEQALDPTTSSQASSCEEDPASPTPRGQPESLNPQQQSAPDGDMVEVLSSETVRTTGLEGRKKSSDTVRHNQSLFSRMHPWIASLTALTALMISTITLVRQSGYPEIIVTLPPRIRIEIDDSTGNSNLMFIQPTFSVVEKTDRVGLISSMRVELKKRGGSEELRLQWDETGEWRLNPEGSGTTYKFMADPTPLIITQEAPQSPQALFQTNEKYTAGTWDVMLIANRAADQPDLKIHFCLIIREELVNRMSERLGSTFSLWNDAANGSLVEDGPAQCYERL